jgi:hypothetical protein
MKVRAYIFNRLDQIAKTFPDLAEPVRDALTRYTRGTMSTDDFANLFNRVNMEYTQRSISTGDNTTVSKHRTRKAIAQPKVTTTTATFDMVNKMHWKHGLRVENPEAMDAMLQSLYDYVKDSFMNVFQDMVRDRVMWEREPESAVQNELWQSARREELEYNQMMRKRAREEPQQPEVDAQLRDTNDTAMSFLPKFDPLPRKRRKPLKANSSTSSASVRITKVDFVNALIRLKTFHPVLSRTRMVIKLLTLGV